MKTTFCEVFVCLLLLGTFVVATLDTAAANDEDDYTITISNQTAIITGYTGMGGAITIPSNLGGYPTTHIWEEAFKDHDSITSVIIPDSVITIGQYAFEYCTALTSVTIGNSVTILGDYAFQYCDKLSSVIIGSSMNAIGNYAFRYCESLTSLTFLGLVTPTYAGDDWILDTHPDIRGHAYAASNFPAPGEVWKGLTMGTVLTDEAGGENKPPVADFSWTPATPTVNQTITFDASASSDPDGSVVFYEWDWNNDGIYEQSHSTPTTTHTWTHAGNYPVTLRVTDNHGATHTKTLTVPVSTDGTGNGDSDENGTPGFELLCAIGAIAVALLMWKKKQTN